MKRPASVQLAAFSIHDLNQELLASDIGLVATQHLESGPERDLLARWPNETKALWE
jgi:hypothetical protein